MKKTYISLLVCLTVFSISLKADDVLYCISELATGVHYENGKWATNDFENIRFTMKFNSDYTEFESGFDRTSKPSVMSCEEVFPPRTPSLRLRGPMIMCREITNGSDFLIFHKKTLTFQFAMMSSAGYSINATYLPPPSIMYVGQCEKF